MYTAQTKFVKILCLILICTAFNMKEINAQVAKPMQSSFWDNVRFGGGIGLNFGSGFFAGNLAPIGVYRFNQYVSTGVGLNFAYTSERNFYDSFVVGGSFLGFFNPIREIQISTEFQQSYVNRTFDSNVSFTDEKYWVPAIFLGLGYTTNNVTVGIQYDLLYDRNRSIYADSWFPFVRVLF